MILYIKWRRYLKSKEEEQDREQKDEKAKKIFLITAGVIMIMLRLCVYVYPAYNTWNTDRNMRRQMEAFQARNEAAIQKENNTGDSTNSNEETAEARPLGGIVFPVGTV